MWLSISGFPLIIEFKTIIESIIITEHYLGDVKRKSVFAWDNDKPHQAVIISGPDQARVT